MKRKGGSNDWEKIKHKIQDKHSRYDWYINELTADIRAGSLWNPEEHLCFIFFVSLLVSERTQNTVMLF